MKPTIKDANPRNDGKCQNCEDNDATQVVRISIDERKVGGVFVCDRCFTKLKQQRDNG